MMVEPSPRADRTEIREVEAPRAGPGEVTIDVAYAGINFVDVMARRGDAGYVLEDAAGFRPGDAVLVHSAGGGVGGAVAQLVPVLGGGLRVGTVGHAAKVGAALRNGYDVAVSRDENLAEAVREATDRAGVDIVLDPLGTTMLETDLAVTAPGGRIILFGNAGGGPPTALPPIGRLIGGNLAIGGFSVSRLWAGAPRRAAAGLRRVLDLIADGRLHVATSEVGSLAEVPAVHQLLAEGHSEGKYVARVQG